MSGHSHWSTIKHKKAAEDVKRGQAYTKATRLITVAARKSRGGGNLNAKDLFEHPPAELKTAIDKAKAVNMPKDNIIRAIEKGAGSIKGAGELEEGTLEGYGPSGIAFYITFLTDNRNRTLAEVRSIFTKHGGNLGEAGSTAYIFSSNPDEPLFNIPVTELELAEKLLTLAKLLDEHDDIQEVHANFDIHNDIIAQVTDNISN